MKEDLLRCPAYDAIQVLQEKWVLHIVRTLLTGPRGFNELGREIGGCNPTTLTQRLVLLENMQLVTKSVQSRLPPRCTYELTEAGRALDEVVMAIDGWAQQHMESCQFGASGAAATAERGSSTREPAGTAAD